jgi:hypothetical protein
MTATYDSIASTTLATNSTSVSFSNISGTYTDLVVVFSGSHTAGPDSVKLRFNNNTTSSYSQLQLIGDGSSAYTTTSGNISSISVGNVNGVSNNIVHIMNYSNTVTNKFVIGRGDEAGQMTVLGIGRYGSTDAITTVTVFTSANFASGSVFSLYGIKAE